MPSHSLLAISPLFSHQTSAETLLLCINQFRGQLCKHSSNISFYPTLCEHQISFTSGEDHLKSDPPLSSCCIYNIYTVYLQGQKNACPVGRCPNVSVHVSHIFAYWQHSHIFNNGKYTHTHNL